MCILLQKRLTKWENCERYDFKLVLYKENCDKTIP